MIPAANSNNMVARHSLNEQRILNIDPPQECPGFLQMKLITDSLSGISGSDLSELKMKRFEAFPQLSLTFEIQAMAPFLQTMYSGKIVSGNTNCTSVNFTDVGEARNATLVFSFEAFLSLLRVGVQRVTIVDMSLQMPVSDLDLPFLGIYESKKESIEEDIGEGINNAIESRFNKIALQEAMDRVFPYTLF